jgi:septum formation protein
MIPQVFFVLASRSPRRQELLAEAGYRFQVLVPDDDVECGVCSEAGPAGLVSELAYRKAAAIVRKLQSNPTMLQSYWKKAETATSHDGKQSLAIVLGADTVAECEGLILGKPQDETHARAMLRQLSGREHRVLTGVCLWPLSLGTRKVVGGALPLIRVAATRLRMDSITDAQLDDYLASGQWEGKAGAFGYQDRLGWVHIVEGSATNVVGLPMELLSEMIEQLDGRTT